MTELFHNRYRIPSTRLPNYNYGQPGFYFVTICTKNRFCYFCDFVDGNIILNDIGKIILNELLKTPQMRPNIELDEFIIMPNHIHAIIIITETQHNNNSPIGVETHCNASLHHDNKPYHNKFGPQRNNLPSIIRGFKSATTKIINQKYGRNHFAWQPRFHDHVIRNEKSLFNIRQYIINNPKMWNKDRNNPDGLLL